VGHFAAKGRRRSEERKGRGGKKREGDNTLSLLNKFPVTALAVTLAYCKLFL